MNKPTVVDRFRALFGRAPDFVARAPGRIEFIGNHTDYNGGTVLGAAIDRGVWVAVAARTDGPRRFATDQRDGVLALAAGAPEKQAGAASWTNYPLGILAALPAFGLRAPGGFDYLAMSDLPLGAGLSSSAAIEVSSALAFLALTNQAPSRETVVKVGRHAENHFVGVPCGILDQGVSGFGQKNRLVFIDCRGPHFDTVSLPAGAHFWIFNTHTKHALIDGLYASRHRECMEAAKALGVAQLADVTPAVFAQRGTSLPATLSRRAAHIVGEIARVGEVRGALGKDDLAAVGLALNASHASSRTQFENSTPELDFLVEILATAPHVYGARLTGGGFGGAVMALTAEKFAESDARKVAEAYAQKFDAVPDILHTQTGDGAALV